jgi:hypothetical protein
MINVRESRKGITNNEQTIDNDNIGKTMTNIVHMTQQANPQSHTHTHTHIEKTNKMSPMGPHQEKNANEENQQNQPHGTTK